MYAKTDIQPLLNQGVSREDLALSAVHAIAKQTIGGLAQGLDIRKPVAFEGGPRTFNPTLIRVFQERLKLSEEETLIPDRPEMMIAYGAALSLLNGSGDNVRECSYDELLAQLLEIQTEKRKALPKEKRNFLRQEKRRRNFKAACPSRRRSTGCKVRNGDKSLSGHRFRQHYYKNGMLGEDETILDSFYGPNEGRPLDVAKKALLTSGTDIKKQEENWKSLPPGPLATGSLCSPRL